LIGIEAQIAKLDKAILATHRKDDVSVRLATIPGIGPIIASCLSASVSNPELFEGGREFAAWLGLIPRQHSTGGKPRLGPISKMGNRHLRKLLVVGAHAALYSMKKGKTQTPLADWARSLLSKKPFKEALQTCGCGSRQQDGPDRMGGHGTEQELPAGLHPQQ
jgi:transposase